MERDGKRASTTPRDRDADADSARRSSVNRDLMASQLDFTIALCPSRRHFTLTDQIRRPDTLAVALPLNSLACATLPSVIGDPLADYKTPLFPFQTDREREREKGRTSSNEGANDFFRFANDVDANLDTFALRKESFY